MKKYLGLHNKINNRFFIISIIIIISFLIILFSLVKITVFDNQKYSKALNELKNITYIGEKGLRGNIYDRNNKLLVGNKEVKVIVYSKENDNTYKDEIKISSLLSKILDIDYSLVNIDDIKEFYYYKNKNYMDNIISENIKSKYEKGLIDESTYKNYMYSLITDERLSVLTDEHKKSAYIFKLMNDGYSFEEKIIKYNVSEEEIISLNEEKLIGISVSTRYERYYPYGDIFRTFLGDMGKIPYEEKNNYINEGYKLNDIVGVSYLEKEYENVLRGQNEIYRILPNGSKEIINNKESGNDIVLSIDIELQKEIENVVYENIIKAKNESNTKYYDRSFVILTDFKTGEVIASVGVGVSILNNEYVKVDRISDLINYSITPGSIVKGASHLVGYNAGYISFGTKVTDGCLYIKNSPKKCSWRSLGVINDIDALTYSSNYYQYLIAIKVGGGTYRYNMPLNINSSGFDVYRKMFNSFGLGVKTGIDLPNENVGYRGDDTYLASLLDFPIGQYDTYTPFGISQYIMTLANSGTRIAPHYLKKVMNGEKEIYSYEPKIMGKVDTTSEYMNRVQEGLKTVLERGTGYGYVNLKYNPYGKTGTAESFIDTDADGKIDTKTISSAFGFYSSYNDKNISMVMLSPNVSNLKTSYISSVNYKITRKVSDLYFEK